MVPTISQVIPGVSADVSDRMVALSADVLADDNMLFRTCAHGVKHPVGHLTRDLRRGTEHMQGDEVRHHRHGQTTPCITTAQCCGCCAEWTGSVMGDE
jgi:hypothetical protein